MSEHHTLPGLSRRAFLRSAGLAAGALAAAPLLNATPAWAAGPKPAGPLPIGRDLLTIGVLLPQSTIYPALGSNFLAGMQLYFNQAADGTPAVRLVAEDAGFGQAQATVAAQKLLDTGKASLVVGLGNPMLAGMLRGLFQARRTFFLAAGLGENVPRQSADSAYVFHHTLGAWQGAWALGQWAATHLGRRAAVATSFYDSGYDMLSAFHLGFTAAGGTVATTQTTHLLANSPALPAVLAEIAATRPDFVYGAYCGPAAVDFVRAYAQAAPLARTPLLGSTFLAGETALPTLGKAALGIKTALGWTPALETAENRAFLAAYAKQTGQVADSPALLGYETAHLAATALAGVAGDASRINEMRAALAAAAWTGPRGRIAMDAQTHCTDGPLYLREVHVRGGALANMPVTPLLAAGSQDGGAGLRTATKTGWVNAYLSV